MRVFESQSTGSVAILLISLAVYGVSLLNARQPARYEPLPWGSQGPGLMAVEFSGDRGRDGVYFLPEGISLDTILLLIGSSDANSRKKTGPVEISTGAALMVSPQGEVSIGEMTAARKLALGLPVDLNRISEEELALVPGIGEKTAYQIIQLRQKMGEFRDLADLKALPGIKDKKLNSLKGYLAVKAAKGGI